MIRIVMAALLLAAAFPAPAQSTLDAPNVVVISPKLTTSGQPGARELGRLAKQGFGAVINLAPSTTMGAVKGEEGIVRGQGLEYVHIPVVFSNPTEADYRAFVEAMNRLRDKKVLVHCEVNMRASTMTFLYRVSVDHEAPEKAYEAVARVWAPRGPWKALMMSQLRKAGVAFDPY
jgi:protein tyrosine phosphatase (PTP) superfamily phosphohydrolase (DUF442 family)